MQELSAKAKDEKKIAQVLKRIKESKWGGHFVNICESNILDTQVT